MRVSLSLASAKLPAGVSETFLRSIIRRTCQEAFPKLFQESGRGVQLEVAFVSDSRIAKLNHEYRGKEKPTDVLSFGEFEERGRVAKATAKTLALGTLILSLPFIRRSAREDGVSWEREFVFVFSHGVLHLLGFDHEERMFAIQDMVTDHFAPLKKQK
jgi:probable rRNA maturation factor